MAAKKRLVAKKKVAKKTTPHANLPANTNASELSDLQKTTLIDMLETAGKRKLQAHEIKLEKEDEKTREKFNVKVFMDGIKNGTIKPNTNVRRMFGGELMCLDLEDAFNLSKFYDDGDDVYDRLKIAERKIEEELDRLKSEIVFGVNSKEVKTILANFKKFAL